MPKHRIFIAIQVSEEVKNAGEFYLKPFLSARGGSAFGGNDKNIRIPKREGWHVTLVFCGYLDEKEIEELKKIVKNVSSEFKSFEISPFKILFAPPNRPRMIWLNFNKSSQFADLKNKIENSLISRQKDDLFRNFRKENREPNPHLTLARFEEKYFPNVKKFLPENGIDLTEETAPFLAESIDIMESHLSRSGADYKILTKIILGV
jgi:2'-5' RNA ligase